MLLTTYLHVHSIVSREQSGRWLFKFCEVLRTAVGWGWTVVTWEWYLHSEDVIDNTEQKRLSSEIFRYVLREIEWICNCCSIVGVGLKQTFCFSSVVEILIGYLIVLVCFLDALLLCFSSCWLILYRIFCPVIIATGLPFPCYCISFCKSGILFTASQIFWAWAFTISTDILIYSAVWEKCKIYVQISSPDVLLTNMTVWIVCNQSLHLIYRICSSGNALSCSNFSCSGERLKAVGFLSLPRTGYGLKGQIPVFSIALIIFFWRISKSPDLLIKRKKEVTIYSNCGS